MGQIVRSYVNNFEFIDRTPQLLIIPNQWDIINQLNIFPAVEGVMSNTVSLEQIIDTTAIMVDRVRGERNNYSKDSVRKLYSFPIPHFPLDDALTPADIQGKTAYGTNDMEEQVSLAVARKLSRIRRSHAMFMEIARAKLLEDGTVYAPNGTVSVNYYTEFGISRKEIDFAFGTSTSDILGKGEEGIAHIYDNILNGTTSISGFVAICHPTFFANLIKHPTTKTAYQYYTSVGAQEPLRQRLSSALPRGTRMFDYGGITYVEYRGLKPDGTPFVPAGEARLVPTEAFDIFGSYAAPAQKMDLVNTVGMEAYVFEYRDPKGNGIEFESESNLLHVARRPAVIVRLYSSN